MILIKEVLQSKTKQRQENMLHTSEGHSLKEGASVLLTVMMIIIILLEKIVLFTAGTASSR